MRVRARVRARVRVVNEDRGPTEGPEEARPVVQSNLFIHIYKVAAPIK